MTRTATVERALAYFDDEAGFLQNLPGGGFFHHLSPVDVAAGKPP